MSGHGNKLLQDLVLYGNTGHQDVLLRIGQALGAGQKFGTVHLPVALKASKHLLRLLANPAQTNLRSLTWHCLLALSSATVNQQAGHFLIELEKKSVLLEHVRDSCLSTREREQAQCIMFLFNFSCNSNSRCRRILLQAGLLDALLFVVRSFDPTSRQTTGTVLVTTILRIIQSIVRCADDKNVELEGKSVLDDLLAKVAPFCQQRVDVSAPNFVEVVEECVNTHHACYSRLLERQHDLFAAGCRELLCLHDEIQAIQIINHLYVVMRYLWTKGERATMRNNTPIIVLSALGLCYYSMDAVRHVEEPHPAADCSFNFLRQVFTYNGEGPVTSGHAEQQAPEPTFIQYLMQIITEKNSCADADSVFQFVRERPQLKPVVEEQVGKFEFCGHPDCSVTNYLPGRLKKCVRCRGAWYCGKEHQVAHWPEHKKTCQRSTVSDETMPA